MLARIEIHVLLEEASRRFPHLHRDRAPSLRRSFGLQDAIQELRLLVL
jgi:cytochrome P450